MPSKSNVDALFFDPSASGHHTAYLTRMLTAALRGGCIRVAFAASPALLARSEIQEIRALHGDAVLALPAEPPVPRVFAGAVAMNFWWWSSARRWYEEFSKTFAAKKVIFPYLDYFLYASSVLGPPVSNAPVYGLTMRAPATGGSGFAAVKRLAFARVVENQSIEKIFVIDPTVAEDLSDIPVAAQAKVVYLADPAGGMPMSKRAGREILKIDERRFVIVMFGAISERKGLSHLLAVIGQPGIHPSVTAMIVGELDERSAAAISRQPEAVRKRITLIPHYVDDSYTDALFSAADCVWLVYREHLGMSGVQVQAGVFGKPVIASKDGLIGRYTREFDMGLTVSGLDVLETTEAINHLVGDPASACMKGERGRIGFAAHSNEAFIDRFSSAVFGSTQRPC
jgi:glycosyltransferase involved in cell wall biosynthesis